MDTCRHVRGIATVRCIHCGRQLPPLWPTACSSAAELQAWQAAGVAAAVANERELNMVTIECCVCGAWCDLKEYRPEVLCIACGTPLVLLETPEHEPAVYTAELVQHTFSTPGLVSPRF
jgi:hypothetical protein